MSSLSGAVFPLEIFDKILRSLVQDSRDRQLLAPSLVSKAFRRLTNQLLVQTGVTTDFTEESKARLDWLLRSLSKDPSLAFYVRRICFDINSIDDMTNDLAALYEEAFGNFPVVDSIIISSPEFMYWDGHPALITSLIDRVVDIHASRGNLHSLVVKGIVGFPGGSASLCKTLRELQFDNCFSPLLTQPFSQLARLTLNSCSNFPALSLSKCFPNLKELEINESITFLEKEEDITFIGPTFSLSRLTFDTDSFGKEIISLFKLLGVHLDLCNSHIDALVQLTDLYVSVKTNEEASVMKALLHHKLLYLHSLSIYFLIFEQDQLFTTTIPTRIIRSLHHLSFGLRFGWNISEGEARPITTALAFVQSIPPQNELRSLKLHLHLPGYPTILRSWGEFQDVLECCLTFPKLTEVLVELDLTSQVWWAVHMKDRVEYVKNMQEEINDLAGRFNMSSTCRLVKGYNDVNSSFKLHKDVSIVFATRPV